MKKNLLILAILLLSACTPGKAFEPIPDPDLPTLDFTTSERIQKTNGVKHNVPLSSIKKDTGKVTFLAVNEPTFLSIAEADEQLDPENPGIAIEMNGIERFYPFNASTWHIVNDDFNGSPALVTYCPICASGVAFEPSVQGKSTKFEVTGELWNDNMVMVDSLTKSRWSQILGQAITGKSTGDYLPLLSYENLSYESWKAKHPNGQVMEYGILGT
jgi:hypothetical protein